MTGYTDIKSIEDTLFIVKTDIQVNGIQYPRFLGIKICCKNVQDKKQKAKSMVERLMQNIECHETDINIK